MQAMAKKMNIRAFEMEETVLKYDLDKSTLLCAGSSYNGKKLWIKKLPEISYISNIIEDNKRYYIACESGEINGQFIAVSKDDGSTEWFIPGRSFLQIIFSGFLYLIFVDENNHYYLLKVNRNNGRSSWHHRVEQNLREYSFTKKEIRLSYSSGKKEVLSVRTGKKIQN